MSSISRKLSSLKPSPTLALNAKAKALKADGNDVLNMAVGEPDFDTPSIVVDEAIKALKAGMTRYGVAGGGPEFKKAVADKLKRENGLEYTAD
jgi:aspartate aminotransferase